MFKALREIIAKSFSSNSIRMSRAAYWYAVIVVLLILLLIISISFYIIYTYRYSDFIKDLYGILILCIFIFGLPLGSWLLVMGARRIRDAGFRAKWYYVYNAIIAVAYFLTLISANDMRDYQTLALFLSIPILLINITILAILLKPTSKKAELRFGKAIEYKHNILKELKILGISVGAILLCVGIFFIVKEESRKKDGCYINSSSTSYIGDIKDEYGNNVIGQIKSHFFDVYSGGDVTKEGFEFIPSLPLLDFSTLIGKSKEELNGTLECYYDNKPNFSAELKDGKFNGKVRVSNINLEFEKGIIKDGVLRLKAMSFIEKREYKDGYLKKMSYIPYDGDNTFEAFEIYYDKGLISKDVELIYNGKKLLIPHKYGVRFGMMKNGDESCFVFGDEYGCRARIEHHNDNGKVTIKYFDEHNKPTSEKKIKGLIEPIVLFYYGKKLMQATLPDFTSNFIYIFRDDILQGIVDNKAYSDTMITIFSNYGGLKIKKGTNKGTLDRIYNKILTIPKEKMHTSQKNGKTLYQPQNRHELLSLISDESIKLDSIDTSKIKDMRYLFTHDYTDKQTAYYEELYMLINRQDFSGIESWDTSNVENMRGMFNEIGNFNQNINSWNVSKVKDMSLMFKKAKSFNQPLNKWNTSNVENMEEMFYEAGKFNQNINSWNVSKVKNMSSMFYNAESFNQPLNSWNTSNVNNMNGMFNSAESFNQPLNSWNTGNVNDMNGMFYQARSFNQNINSWNVSKVKDMSSMFYNAESFNQNLESWGKKLSKDCNIYNMFFNSSLESNPPKWYKEREEN